MGATAAKSEQLGMPIGTANARLRKMVLFDVLRRHGENVCCRCGEKIESVMELSLEHKKPWLHVSADLFWDLDNIGFSHTRCNQPTPGGEVENGCGRWDLPVRLGALCTKTSCHWTAFGRRTEDGTGLILVA